MFTFPNTSSGSVRCRPSAVAIIGAAFLTLVSSCAFAVIPAAERTVLTNLYASTDGPTWANSTGWNGPIGTECSWYGISCDAQQSHVIGIDFLGNTLIGTLPPLSAHDCAHTTLHYQFNDGRSGSISQTRLTDVQGCTASVPAGPIGSFFANYDDVAHSGAWYDPQTSGQGIVVDLVPTQSTLFAAWYTYAPQAEAQTDNASQRWFTLQSAYVPGNLTINQVPIYSVVGGAFNTATRTAGLQVGTADIMFSSCNTMSINYHFTQGEFAGLSGSVNEQKIALNPSCH